MIQTTPYTLDDLEAHLTEAHLEMDGGYPYDSKWINDDLFVVAEIDHDGSSRIVGYTRATLDNWLNEANEFREEVLAREDVNYWDDSSIFSETAPPADL